jgi:hypothetical protein
VDGCLGLETVVIQLCDLKVCVTWGVGRGAESLW